jgi:hypothetical protein
VSSQKAGVRVQFFACGENFEPTFPGLIEKIGYSSIIHRQIVSNLLIFFQVVDLLRVYSKNTSSFYGQNRHAK